MSTRIEALMAELWRSLGLNGAAPQGEVFEFTLGTDVIVNIAGENDDDLLIVAPVAPLPANPEWGMVQHLLRANGADSADFPFAIGSDEEGMIYLWARMPVAAVVPEELESALHWLALRVTGLRATIGGTEDELPPEEESADEPEQDAMVIRM